jgi:hypothetical protein
VLAYSPHSFIAPEQLQARMKRTGAAEDDIEQRLVDAVNAATLWMEQFTKRRLKARNYRTATTIACSASDDSATITGSGFSGLYAGDDMVGTGLQVGSQVSSIESAVSLTANRKTTDALSSTSVSFGSLPLRVSGDASIELYLPEFPLVQLYSLYRDDAGTLTAIDTTGAYYDYETGYIVLANDKFPRGNMNIVINARCGYAQPTATDLGSWAYAALEAAAMRCAEVLFTDALQVRGRSDNFSAGGVSASFSDYDMPKDVLAMLAPFVRRWR